MGKRHLDVVCGIIVNELGQVLVSLRDSSQDHGGLWEFPGGKLELGEALEEALWRELSEELDIEVREAQPWLQINHDYPSYHITLHVWKIMRYEGEPEGLEGQLIRWVSPHELAQLKFLAANHTIIEALNDGAS